MRLLQRFATPLQAVVTLGLFAELAALYGTSAFPSIYLVARFWSGSAAWEPAPRLFVLSLSLFGAFFLFALVLIAVVGVFRLLTFGGTPIGRYPYYSVKGFRWATYNALILAVRFTVMDFLRVTPFLVLFHRLMGMRCGARVLINTKVIADSNLISIGDDSVVGGDVTLVCHSAEGGDLVTAPVKIGKRVTIGLMAIVLPGCEIGDGAIIGANSVLSKGTKVPPYTVWAGIPAKQVGERERR